MLIVAAALRFTKKGEVVVTVSLAKPGGNNHSDHEGRGTKHVFRGQPCPPLLSFSFACVTEAKNGQAGTSRSPPEGETKEGKSNKDQPCLLLFAVRDTGVGIPKEKFGKLSVFPCHPSLFSDAFTRFKVFSQLDSRLV